MTRIPDKKQIEYFLMLQRLIITKRQYNVSTKDFFNFIGIMVERGIL